jgi:hypothetical protein
MTSPAALVLALGNPAQRAARAVAARPWWYAVGLPREIIALRVRRRDVTAILRL